MDVQQTSRFADRVLRLLERVEYRRADSPADKAAIYRLRHDAYMRAGTVEPRPSGMFHDAMDEKDNAWLIGLFIDSELAGALRLHISASVLAPLPELTSFSDLIEPHLAAGQTLIDGSRFVSRLEFSQRYSEIPYLTIRPTLLAAEFFAADYGIAGCLAEHQAFYRRIYGAVVWSAPRPYPHFKRSMALVAYDCNVQREKIHERYPFYQSTQAERVRLFQRSSNAADRVLEAIGRREQRAGVL
jgi:N-acyl-L-homoserine lactone synthetase